MSAKQVKVPRPQRWDAPFCPDMSDEAVSGLMDKLPFRAMNEAGFSSKLPLRGILKNDCRINRYQAGDIVIRQGDYGNSAFLILEGTALVSLAPMPPELLGRSPAATRSWIQRA